MLLVTELKRKFVFREKQQTIDLSDPDTQWSPVDVLNFYAAQYPILTTAKVGAYVIKDDAIIYQFECLLGTKG